MFAFPFLERCLFPGYSTSVVGYELDKSGIRGLVVSRGKRFSLLHSVRTSSGPTKPPLRCVQGTLSSWVDGSGLDADYSPPYSAEVKNSWSYIPTPHKLYDVVLNYIENHVSLWPYLVLALLLFTGIFFLKYF
jgi:hypothetical protein